MQKLRIIVPSYNEGKCVFPFYEGVMPYLNNPEYEYEILYVDDYVEVSGYNKQVTYMNTGTIKEEPKKTNPVVIINFDLSDLYKQEVIEKQLYRKKEIKKEKKKISSKQKLKKEIENFTKTGIKPTNLNDGSFLELVDYLNQIN